VAVFINRYVRVLPSFEMCVRGKNFYRRTSTSDFELSRQGRKKTMYVVFFYNKTNDMHQFLIFIFRIELYITSIIAARIMESIYFSLTNKYIFLLNLEKFKFT